MSRKPKFPLLDDAEIRAELGRRAAAKVAEPAETVSSRSISDLEWVPPNTSGPNWEDRETNDQPAAPEATEKQIYRDWCDAAGIIISDNATLDELRECAQVARDTLSEVKKIEPYPTQTVGFDTADDIDREVDRLRRAAIAERLIGWCLSQTAWPNGWTIRRTFCRWLWGAIDDAKSKAGGNTLSAKLPEFARWHAAQMGLDTTTLADGRIINRWSSDDYARHLRNLSGGKLMVEQFSEWLKREESAVATLENLEWRKTSNPDRTPEFEWQPEDNIIRGTKRNALKKIGYDPKTLIAFANSPYECYWFIRRDFRSAWQLLKNDFSLRAIANFHCPDKVVLLGDNLDFELKEAETAFALIKAGRAVISPPAASRF